MRVNGERLIEIAMLNSLLSIVIPVKNEERNLAECLENIKAFENVIIVDSGSTDRTLEIAKEFGREVVQFEWNGQFPKKRNWVLRNYQFKTRWVMFLDADERIRKDGSRRRATSWRMRRTMWMRGFAITTTGSWGGC